MISISWGDIDDRLSRMNLADVKVWGIPRGGVIVAGLARRHGAIVVGTPQEAEMAIDDVIDSGATSKLMKDKYNLQTIALVDKSAEGIDSWVQFPWEESSINTVPLDTYELLADVYRSAYTVISGSRYTTVNELTDQIPSTRPKVLRAATTALINLGSLNGATKILTEEDKGAILASIVSYELDLPLAVARMYPYEIPGALMVPIDMEYFKGHLLANGLEPGDRLMIIDDTLATGGTIISLCKAALSVGAEVVDIRVVTEKLGSGGRRRISDELGVTVKAAIGIRINEHGVISVEEVMEAAI